MANTFIQPSILAFLTDLSVNNNRDWFMAQKDRFSEAKQDFKVFADALLMEMNKIDHIEALKLYRIYRDVRFSKDKIPYKNSMSGSMSRATKLLRGGYYFHIEPGNCFLAGGFWEPSKEDLARIRHEIAYDSASLLAIINSEDFKKSFAKLDGDQLKSAPKGYPRDHEAIELLRYKNFLLMQKFTDEEVLQPAFLQSVVQGFQAMRPFFDYISDVLTTDENGVLIV